MAEAGRYLKAADKEMTVAEVAERCNVTSRCVTGWARRGVVPGARKRGGVWRFNRAQFENWKPAPEVETSWGSIGEVKFGGSVSKSMAKRSDGRLERLLGL